MTEFKLWVKRAWGAEWFTISDTSVAKLEGYIFLKRVEIDIDRDLVDKRLSALTKLEKSAKRDALLKELEALDNE